MPALSVEMKGVCTRDVDAGYQGDGEGKGLGLWEHRWIRPWGRRDISPSTQLAKPE